MSRYGQQKKGSLMKPISMNWPDMKKSSVKSDGQHGYCVHRDYLRKRRFAPSRSADFPRCSNCNWSASRVLLSWSLPPISSLLERLALGNLDQFTTPIDLIMSAPQETITVVD